jgi:hypothetical protein
MKPNAKLCDTVCAAEGALAFHTQDTRYKLSAKLLNAKTGGTALLNC